jgi:hypothetical protein
MYCIFKMSDYNQRLPFLTLYSTKKEINTTWDMLAETHFCAKCDQDFNLLESMGTLGCSQHPGYLQKNGRYSCCGDRLPILRYVDNYNVTSLFHISNRFNNINGNRIKDFQVLPPIVRGCQRCDHSTSTTEWTHGSKKPLSELSAVVPHMFKHGTHLLQRPGFDDGDIRRCEKQRLDVNLLTNRDYDEMTYTNLEGKLIEKQSKSELPEFGTRHEIYKDGKLIQPF